MKGSQGLFPSPLLKAPLFVPVLPQMEEKML